MNTTFGVLARCQVEQMMTKKRNEGFTVEQDMNLIEASDLESLVPDLATELKQIYIFWDAVCLFPL